TREPLLREQHPAVLRFARPSGPFGDGARRGFPDTPADRDECARGDSPRSDRPLDAHETVHDRDALETATRLLSHRFGRIGHDMPISWRNAVRVCSGGP